MAIEINDENPQSEYYSQAAEVLGMLLEGLSE